MNTNNLKRFAKEASIKLLDQVGRKLEFVLTHDTHQRLYRVVIAR